MIGVLALHGDFAEHGQILTVLEKPWKEVRTPADLEDCTGLVLPGGESTVIMKLMQKTGLDRAICDKYMQGMAIFGTCAGAIVLSKGYLGLLDVEVERNGYGRQIDSFQEDIDVVGIGVVSGSFIRAPIIKTTGPNLTVLACTRGFPVLVEGDGILVSTFHPEVRNSTELHRYFCETVAKKYKPEVLV